MYLQRRQSLVAVPSLSEPHFMEGHYIATQMGLLPRKNVIVRTIDTGGAGPITGLLEADRMVRTQGCDLVALVAGMRNESNFMIGLRRVVTALLC